MGATFAVETTHRSGSAVIEAHGELDMATAGRFHDAFAEVDTSTQGLVVDLTGVSFMDSSGISVLVESCGKAKVAGISWELLVAPGPVLRVLEVTDLVDRLSLRVVDVPGAM